MMVLLRSTVLVLLGGITIMFLALGILVPLVFDLKRAFSKKTLEASVVGTRYTFIFWFLGIMSFVLFQIVKEPNRVWEAILTGVGLIFSLFIFFTLTILAIGISQGKFGAKKAVREILGLKGKK